MEPLTLEELAKKNKLQEIAAWEEEALNRTGLPEASRGIGQWLGQQVGLPESYAQTAGEVAGSLPLMAADFAQAAGVGALTEGVGFVPTLAGLAGTHAYGRTGSPLHALIAGGAMAALPGLGKFGSQAALKAVGAPTGAALAAGAEKFVGQEALGNFLGKAGEERIAQGPGQWLAGQIGEQGAVGAGMVGQGVAERAVEGQPLVPTGEEVFGAGLSAVPFVGLHAVASRLNPAGRFQDNVLTGARETFRTDFVDRYSKLTGRQPDAETLETAMQTAEGGKVQSFQSSVRDLMQLKTLRTADQNVDYATAVGDLTKLMNLPSTLRVDELALRSSLEQNRKDSIGRDRTKDEVLFHTSNQLRARAVQDAGLVQRAESGFREIEQSAAGREQREAQGRSADEIFAQMATDPEMAKRVSRVSGSREQQVQAGLLPDRSTIDKKRVRLWIKETSGKDKELSDLDVEAGARVFEEGTPEEQSTVEQLVREGKFDAMRAISDRIAARSGQEAAQRGQEQALEAEGQSIERELEKAQPKRSGVLSKFKQLTPEATEAAQQAAANYDKPLNWADPESVKKFDSYISAVIDTAEEGFLKRKGEQKIVANFGADAGAEQEAIRYAANENATASKESGKKYYPEQVDGNWRVREITFIRKEMLQSEGKGQLADVGKEEAENLFSDFDSDYSEVVGAKAPDQVEHTVENHFVKAQQEARPGVREASLTALMENLSTAMNKIPEAELRKVVTKGRELAGLGETQRVRTGKLLSRYFAYIRFLRDGGSVPLEISRRSAERVIGTVQTKAEALALQRSWEGSLIREEPLETGGKEYRVVKSTKGRSLKTVKVSKSATTEDLIQLNKYLQEMGVGFEHHGKLKEAETAFFQQMVLMSELVKKQFTVPSDLYARPRGEFGFRNEFVDPKTGQVLPKAQWPGATVGPKGETKWHTKDTGPYQNEVIEWTDAKGVKRLLEHNKGGWKTGSPLAVLFDKLWRNEGTVDVQTVANLFLRAEKILPPETTEWLRILTNRDGKRPFTAHLPLGVGVTKDRSVRGLYSMFPSSKEHGGILFSPYDYDPTTGKIRLIEPEEAAHHFVHEVLHAHSSIALASDPALRAEVAQVAEVAHEAYQKLLQSSSKDFYSQSLNMFDVAQRPDEFWVEFGTNADLRALLQTIPDTLPKTQAGSAYRSLFHRLWALFESAIGKLFGLSPREQGTLFGRMQTLMERTLEQQDALRPGVGRYGRSVYDQNTEAIYRGPEEVEQKGALAEGSVRPLMTPEKAGKGEGVKPGFVPGEEQTPEPEETRVPGKGALGTEGHEKAKYEPIPAAESGDTAAYGKAQGEQRFAQETLRAVESFESRVRPDPREFLPQIVSGFTTLNHLYQVAGFEPKAAKAMSESMMRLIVRFKHPEVFRVGMVPEAVADKMNAGGVAQRGTQTVGIAPHGGEAEWSAANIKHVLGHEMFHLVGEDSLVAAVRGLKSEELASILDAAKWAASPGDAKLKTVIPPNFKEGQELTQARMDEWAAEFAAYMSGAFDTLENPGWAKDVMMFTHPDVSQWFRDLVDQQTATVARFRDYLDITAKGNKDRVFEAAGQALGELKQLVRPIQEIERLELQGHELRLTYPDMFEQEAMRHAKNVTADNEGFIAGVGPGQSVSFASRVPAESWVRQQIGLETNKTLNFWEKNFANFLGLVERYPALRPIWDAMNSAQRLAKARYVELQELQAGSFAQGGLSTDARAKNLAKFAIDPKMQEAFDNISREQNKFFEANGRGFDSAELQQKLELYLPKEKQQKLVKEVFQSTLDQLRETGNIITRSHRGEAETVLAMALRWMTKRTLSVEQARNVSKNLFEMAGETDPVRIATIMDQEVTPFLHDPGVLTKAIQKVTEWNQIMAEEAVRVQRGIGGWMSERRFGDYSVKFQDGARISTKYFTDAKRRDAFVRTLGPADLRGIVNAENKGSSNFGLQEEAYETLRAYDAKQNAIIIALMGEGPARQAGALRDTEAELRIALAAQDATNTRIPRTFAESRKFLNMWETQQNYIAGVINASKNKQMRLESALHLTDESFDLQPELKGLVNNHLENVLKPDSQWGRRVATANFTYWLGGNLSTMMLEPFQQLMSLAPVLTSHHNVGPIAPYKYIAKANATWLRGKLTGKFGDPELDLAMERWRREGVADAGIYQELDFNQDLSLVNRLRHSGGLGEYSMFDLMKNKVYAGVNLLRRFYSIVPSYNSEVALIASYKLARSSGMTPEKAFEHAAYLKDVSMFGGGKINRPVGLFSNLNRTLAQGMYSLQSYNTSMLTMMGQLIKDSLPRKGLTPAQRSQSRLALAQMVGTMFTAGGALGMPFVAAGIATLQKLFPGLNIEQAVQETLTNWTKDDDGMMGKIGDFILRGLPNVIQNGPDLSSRFAIGGVLGMSPYSGWEIANLFGPTVSIVQNAIRAGQALQNGEPVQAAQDVLPVSFKRLWETARQGPEYRDSKDRLLLDDLSPTEQAFRAVGFTPGRAAEVRDRARMSRQAEDSASLHLQNQANKLAQLYIDGDVEGAREAFLDFQEENPDLNPQTLLDSLSKKVEDKVFVQDLRLGNHSLSAREQDRLNRAGGASTPPTATERVILRQKIAGSLGIPYTKAPGAGAFKNATALDFLQQMNPFATRETAADLYHPQPYQSLLGTQGLEP